VRHVNPTTLRGFKLDIRYGYSLQLRRITEPRLPPLFLYVITHGGGREIPSLSRYGERLSSSIAVSSRFATASRAFRLADRKVSPLMLRAISEIGVLPEVKGIEASLRECKKGVSSRSSPSRCMTKRMIDRSKPVTSALRANKSGLWNGAQGNKLEHYYYGNCIVKVIAPASISII